MEKKRKDILFILILIICILSIITFNYIIDPYYIFRNQTINGVNDVKIHKYTNKRSIIYSDIKLNNKNNKTAFIGNCVLSNCKGIDNIAFFTLPVVRNTDVLTILKNIKLSSPQIKRVYWGILFDDFLDLDMTGYNDKLPTTFNKQFSVDDFTNLFFSWNTTKYSIETLIESRKNNGQHKQYVYPYRGIAEREYNKDFSTKNFDILKQAIEYSKQNNIELIFYYSPIHNSKKVHIFVNNKWDLYLKMKREIANITPFFDYSLKNDYNYQTINEINKYFIDNVHPSCVYNNIVVNDLLKENKEIGTLLTKENINYQLEKENNELNEYVNKNKKETNKIKNLTKEDSKIKIRI